MPHALDTLLAATESHDQFINDLATWLENNAMVLNVSGCKEDIYDAAEALRNATCNDDEDNEPDESMDGDFDTGMASAGFGTDEDYGGDHGDDWDN